MTVINSYPYTPNTGKSQKPIRGANLVWQGHNVVPSTKNSSLVDRIVSFLKETIASVRSIFIRAETADEIAPQMVNAKDPQIQPRLPPQIKKTISFKAFWRDSSDPVNTIKWDGTYQLHSAIRLGQKDQAASLLRDGANPSLTDSQGLNAFDYALLSKEGRMLKGLFPKESIKAYKNAVQQTHKTLKADLNQRNSVYNFKNKLEALIKERTTIAVDKLSKFNRLLYNGDIDTYKLIGQSDPLQKDLEEHGLSPLHCALLSKNEALVKILVDTCKSTNFLAKDDKDLTPLHYAAMLGLSDSLELLLNKVKGTYAFNIDSAEDSLEFSLANLAIAGGHPQTLALLCHHGANINLSNKGNCSPAELLCLKMKEIDPLNITVGQYILAAFNLLSLATDMISPKATMGLFICSVAANAAFYSQGGFKGQLLYWGGEAFSSIVKLGLVQVPLVKAGVDICRVGNVCLPCIKNVGYALKSVKYETGNALKCIAVNTVIAGSTAFRLKDSLQSIQESFFDAASFINDVLTFNVKKRDELVSFHKRLVQKEGSLSIIEEKLIDFNNDLLRVIQNIHNDEQKLYKLWKYLVIKDRSLITRTQKLDTDELNRILADDMSDKPLAIENPFIPSDNPEIANVIIPEDSGLHKTLQEVQEAMVSLNWTLPNWTYDAEVGPLP